MECGKLIIIGMVSTQQEASELTFIAKAVAVGMYARGLAQRID